MVKRFVLKKKVQDTMGRDIFWKNILIYMLLCFYKIISHAIKVLNLTKTLVKMHVNKYKNIPSEKIST